MVFIGPPPSGHLSYGFMMNITIAGVNADHDQPHYRLSEGDPSYEGGEDGYPGISPYKDMWVLSVYRDADQTLQSRAPAILIGNLLPFCFATVLIVGRYYARLGLLKHFGTDDVFITLGWLAALANCTLACLGTRYGSGRHEVDIEPAWLPTALKLNYATRQCYILSLGFTKLSIAFFYLRVFNVTKAARYHLYLLIACIAAFTIILDLQSVLVCIPPSKAWNTNPSAPGKCSDSISWFWASFACQVISDIWIIVFAIPRVWRLNMQKTQKIALLSTLTLGWVVVLAAIVRVARISAILHAKDTTWISYDSSIWAAVEINVSLTCAAAPALKPIFKRFTPGLVYSLSGKTSQSRPKQTSRSKWAKGDTEGSFGLEMARLPDRRRDLTSNSEEELTHNITYAEHEPLGSPDVDHDGITKTTTTQVSVRSWPGKAL